MTRFSSKLSAMKSSPAPLTLGLVRLVPGLHLGGHEEQVERGGDGVVGGADGEHGPPGGEGPLLAAGGIRGVRRGRG